MLNTAVAQSTSCHIHISLKYDVLKMELFLFSLVAFESLRYLKKKKGASALGLVSHLDMTGWGEDVNALYNEKGG